MYPFLSLLLLLAASLVDASRSSLESSHARRSIKHRQSSILGGLVDGLNGAVTGTSTGLNDVLDPVVSSVLPPSSTHASVSSSTPAQTTPSPTCNDGLLDSVLGCVPLSNSPSPSPTSSPKQASPSASTPPTSCGLLGSLLGCGPPPNNPSPTSASQPASAAPTTTSCDGVIDAVLGCIVSPNNPSSTPTTSPMPASQPASQPASTAPTSCGLLDSLLGCSSPSNNPSPTPASQPASAAPTSSCNGVIDSVLGCVTTTHYPSAEPTPTTSCSIFGILGCTSVMPTTTPESTSSPPSSTVISFPQTTARSTSQTDSSTTRTTSSTPTTSISSNSNYNYLSTVSSLLLNTLEPTSTHTITNPDQPQTTFSLLSAAPTAAPSAPPLPSGLPTTILPQPVLDPNALPSSYVMISVLLNNSLNWPFVATNSDSQGQIFSILPQVIAVALSVDASQVHDYDLRVYEPTDYQGPNDISRLGTIFQAYLPAVYVSPLASLISDRKSVFYTGQPSTMATELAACVDPSFELNAISGPAAGGTNTSQTSSSGSHVRQDAIIGVVSSLGAIAIVVVACVAYKAYQRRHALAHRRLSDDDAYVGMRPEGQEFDQDSMGGQRRRSFYYAEDSLRGFQSDHREEDGYDHHITNMRERRTIQPGTISTPILRESTMNW